MTVPIDARIAQVADRQHGNITRQQLIGLGLGPGAIAHRLKLGRLYRVHQGVCAVGRPPRTALERADAAVWPAAPARRSVVSPAWPWGSWRAGRGG
jgi:hypothetical protein